MSHIQALSGALVKCHMETKMYKYAKSSLTYLKKVHPDLRAVMMEAKNRAEIDFDISCGWRSQAEQMKAYKAGKSQLDGIRYKSKHNYIPALAVDIYAYNGAKADYSKEKLRYLTDIFKEVANGLNIKIECGIDWDDFPDGPHVELA